MSIKSIIEDKYEEESDSSPFDDVSIPVTLRLSRRSAVMLQVIAERFRSNRSRLGAYFLQEAIYEAFSSLTQADKDALSKKADAELKDDPLGGGEDWWTDQAYGLDPKNQIAPGMSRVRPKKSTTELSAVS